MDVLQVLAIMRKHNRIITVGIVIGIIAAIAVSVRVDGSGDTPRLVTRSRTLYATEAQLMISEPRWGLGRAGSDPTRPDPFRKTIEMGPTYARLMVSDAVEAAVEAKLGKLRKTEVVATAMPDSPIIVVKVSGYDKQRIVAVAEETCAALSAYLSKQQADHDVPNSDRLSVSILASPTEPKSEQSRAVEIALLAFLTPLLLSFGVAMLRERSGQPTIAAVNPERSPWRELKYTHRPKEARTEPERVN